MEKDGIKITVEVEVKGQEKLDRMLDTLKQIQEIKKEFEIKDDEWEKINKIVGREFNLPDRLLSNEFLEGKLEIYLDANGFKITPKKDKQKIADELRETLDVNKQSG